MATAGFLDLGLAALTGVGGIAQATAALSYLAFNRGQETEADILGVRLVAEAGYDPHAAYRVWYKILAEEEAAVAKREEPGLLSRTHPNSEERAAYLKASVTTHYGPPDVEQAAVPLILAFVLSGCVTTSYSLVAPGVVAIDDLTVQAGTGWNQALAA